MENRDLILDSFTHDLSKDLELSEKIKRIEGVKFEKVNIKDGVQYDTTYILKKWFIEHYSGDEGDFSPYLKLLPRYLGEGYREFFHDAFGPDFVAGLLVITSLVICSSSVSNGIMFVVFSTIVVPLLVHLYRIHKLKLLVDESLREELSFEDRFTIMRTVARRNVDALRLTVGDRVNQLLAVKDELENNQYDSEIAHLQSLIKSDDHAYRFILDRLVREGNLISQDSEVEVHLLSASTLEHRIDKLNDSSERVILDLSEDNEDKVVEDDHLQSKEA